MGSITFSATGNGGVGTKSRTFTVSDADISRFIVWARATYGNGEGAPAITITQAMNAWSWDMMNSTKERILQFERVNAGNAATLPFNAD